MKQPFKGAIAVSYLAMVIEGSLIIMIVALMSVFALRYGKSASEVTLMLTSKSLGTVLVLYIGGHLSDRFGRRYVILAGAVFFLIFLTGLSLTKSYEAAMVFAFLGGVGHALMDAPSMSLLFDVFGKKAASAQSIIQTFFGGGMAATTFFAGLILRYNWPFQYLLFAGMAMLIVLIVLCLASPFPPVTGKQVLSDDSIHVQQASMKREGALLLLMVGCAAATTSIIQTWTPLFAEIAKGFPKADSVQMLTYYSVGAIAGSLISAAAVRKVPGIALLRLYSIIAIPLVAMLVFIPHPAFTRPILFLMGIALGVFFSLSINTGGELFFRNSGKITGLVGTVNMLANLVIIFVSAQAARFMSIREFYPLMLITLCLTAVFASLLYRRVQRFDLERKPVHEEDNH